MTITINGTTGITNASGGTVLDTVSLAPDGLDATGSAPVFACRAWVDFDWNGSAVVVQQTQNVASVTRLGTGNYRITFTTPMPTSTYVITGLVNQGGGLNSFGVAIGVTAISASAFEIQTRRVTDHTAFEAGCRLAIFA